MPRTPFPRTLSPLLAGLALLLPGLASAAADIAVTPARLQLGRLPQHQVVEREIRIENRGDAPLEISEVYTSCPCTEIALAASTVAPGGSTVLAVTFHSRDLSGENNKTIEISSNDPDASFLEVPLLAFVAAPILVTPSDRNLDFGKVERGETPRVEAALRAEDGGALTLALGTVDATRFAAEILPGAEPAAATLAVSLKPDAVAGPFREVLRVETGDARLPVLDFTLLGSVRGDLATKPGRLNFRFVTPGQTLSKEIAVRAADPAIDFRVTGGEVDLPGLVVEVLADGSAGPARLRVSGSAVAADDSLALANQGRVKGSLRIFTDRPAEPELRVDVLYMLR